jgi:CHAD domain-containing protein
VEEPAGDVPARPALVVGKTPGVTRDDLLAEAGRKVLRFHLARLLAREEGTRTGLRIEDLHGMRVATRRMRAAWRVFGDGFRLDRTRRMRGRLRELAARLGAVRDLDVLIEAARAHQATLPEADAAAFAPLVRAWSDDREVARQLLIRELDSPAYARLVDEYRIFVTAEGAAVRGPASPVAPHRVRDTAGSRIWLAYEQVRGYESVLRWADIETIHQLRIASKWLRYTLEFFREALGPEVDQLVPRVVALQDHLGWLHDADVTIGLTRQFLVSNAARLSAAETEVIAAYLRGRERELEHLRRTIGAPWRGVDGVAFRRLLGRAVSGL